MSAEAMAPPRREGGIRRLLYALFGTWHDRFITICCVAFVVWLVPDLWHWAITDAVWSAEESKSCTHDRGACWAVIDARWRLIMFGLFPFEEHWRSTLACVTIIVVTIASCVPAMWTPRRISGLWVAGFALFYILMRGDVFGLSGVTPDRWGGLALTLFIFASVVLTGFPIAIVLALARQSDMPVIRSLAGFFVDMTRSFPLLAILFTAAVILPFALPEWLQGDKLYRVIAAFSFFFACYQSEIIRGGLQSVAAGQEEAAKALGLGYFRRVWLIMLPQAFRNSLPATINQVVITLKETSIVVIIGFFEIMASGNAAYGTGEWAGAYVEVYAFVAGVYFIFVFSLSRYGAYLERRMRVGLD